MVGLITGGFGFGNIIIQGFLSIADTIGPTNPLSGSLIVWGLGSDKYISQGYGTSDSAEVEPDIVGNIITQGYGFGLIVTQGYSIEIDLDFVDTGIIIGATNDQNTHNGNSIILSGKKQYKVLERTSGDFDFVGLNGRFDQYTLYPQRRKPDYEP